MSHLSRRDFLWFAGGGALALGTTSASCGGETGSVEPDSEWGSIDGAVTDMNGDPRGIGQIYFLRKSGLLDGRFEIVDSDGRFHFSNVEPGEYQLRFHAPRLARVPPDVPHPIHVRVDPGRVTDVVIRIELGVYNESMIEIYAGDDFFQEQPVGKPNQQVTVRLGTVICWYNVGTYDHIVVGGAWGSSPNLRPSDSFIWKADVLGFLPYECSYHLPQMRSSLLVVDE